MEFITRTKEEEELCNNSYISKRLNSSNIDYMNKIYDKPWGKEYLAYQNKNIGIWILHINKDQETSLHCHFKKDTILIPLYGCFKINLYNSYRIINMMEYLYIPRNTFHGIHSYLNNGVIMEIEIYTEKIEYTDKNDLLRIKDLYHRDKDKYETSVVERIPNDDEVMNFHTHTKYQIDKTEINIVTVATFENLKLFDTVILLNGCVYSEEKRITCGSIVDTNKDCSFLTDTIDVLCIRNIDSNYLHKIIYSNSHLIDYLSLHKFKNIGLTCGCFDILHEGHITNLKLCKKNCDVLFVCLSSDEQIRRLKGDKRPVNNISDRLNMLIHYDFIDVIILYNETNDEYEAELDKIMNIVTPDIWFKRY